MIGQIFTKSKKLALTCAFTMLLSCSLLSLTACGGGGVKGYDEIKKAQEDILGLESGKLVITSGMQDSQKGETIKSEFTFKTTTEGAFSFCQMQYDTASKPVYCDFSDGTAASQWFIGKGWSNASLLDYTKENPHRFLKLLSTSHKKENIKEITKAVQGEQVIYTITLNPEALNESEYKDADFSVISQSVDITLDKEGKMCSYSDKSTLSDKKQETETIYSLNIVLSETNTVLEVTRPELREYGQAASGEIEEK